MMLTLVIKKKKRYFTTLEVSVTQLGFAEDTDEQKTEGSEKTC